MKSVNKKVTKVNTILVIVSIIFISVLLLAGYSIDRVSNFRSDFSNSIEQQKRSDARILLKDVVSRFDNAINEGSVDPSSTTSVNKWATYNFNGLRNGSSTSDGFILELGEETYVSDSSISSYNITYSGSSKKVSDVLEYNGDSKELQSIFDRMNLGIDTSYNENISCTINGQKEWLEWADYPTTISVGVNGEPQTEWGLKNPNYKKYVFVLRTKEDEIFKPYQTIFYTLSYVVTIIYILLVALLFFIICIMFYIVYTEYNLKWCSRSKDNSHSIKDNIDDGDNLGQPDN